MSSALRRGGGALLTGLLLALFAGPAWGATSATSARSCSPTSGPVVLQGTDSSGATTQIPLAVEQSQVLASSNAPTGFSPAQAGDAYLLVTLMPTGSTSVALDIPASAVTLQVAGKVLAPAVAPDPFGAQWYFAVPDTMSTATLDVGPASATVGTSAHAYDTAAAAIDFLCSAPPALVNRNAARSPTRGGDVAAQIGAGLGALAVLGAAAGAVHATRRRRFSRAHAQGRVRLLASPLITEPAAARQIVVKILGWLEFAGIDRRTEKVSGPVGELAVYLVLNRGRSFTSLELVDAIWCIGRKPVTGNTVRKYIHEFRKTFGSGVLATEGFTYMLSEAVGCDLEDFRQWASDSAQPAGVLRALGLVRGPVLQGCFTKRKNSPFAWAEDTANEVEVEITRLAEQTAEQFLVSGTPADADVACGAGLRSQPSNLALRLLDLQIGLATGGQAELARRLRAGSSAMAEFSGDVARLEDRARQLGLDGVRRL